VALTAYLTANNLKNTLHIYLILKPDKRIAPLLSLTTILTANMPGTARIAVKI